MKHYIAFGKPVSREYIDLLLSEGVKESEITTEFLETTLEYDYRDAEVII